MSSAARRGGRLKDALTLDDLMLSEVEETSSGDSPLQLLSPQELTKKVLGENGELRLEDVEYEEKIKANYLVEDEEEIAPLPKFNKRKVDPRRQSTAIFSAFEKTTSGMGLLGDSELAVGDEDMELLIPLAKSSAALAAKGISNLWVDPDMEDAFLEEDLPEPSLEVLIHPSTLFPASTTSSSSSSSVLTETEAESLIEREIEKKNSEGTNSMYETLDKDGKKVLKEKK